MVSFYLSIHVETEILSGPTPIQHARHVSQFIKNCNIEIQDFFHINKTRKLLHLYIHTVHCDCKNKTTLGMQFLSEALHSNIQFKTTIFYFPEKCRLLKKNQTLLYKMCIISMDSKQIM